MGDARREITEQDQRFMQRALALAAQARGETAPNPMVGCVIVKDGEIICEAWHKGPGLDHAEAAALKAGDPAKIAGATAYVTLEPCNHTGRTPPCSEALIAANIGEVIYAVDDPNPVAMGGAARLKEAGVAVIGGVLEAEASELNRAWLHAIENKRPFVIAKSAMSLDGRIATANGDSRWITGAGARFAGHQIRMGADAILTGAGTVTADDPALTARAEGETRYPLRVIMDSTARTAPGAKVYERSGKGALLVHTDAAPAARLDRFAEMGVATLALRADDSGRPNLHELMDALYARDIHTLMLEGGGEVLGSFFDADLIDEFNLFIAPTVIGGGKPAFGGAGVAALVDAARFIFEQTPIEGADQHWIGRRRKASE